MENQKTKRVLKIQKALGVTLLLSLLIHQACIFQETNSLKKYNRAVLAAGTQEETEKIVDEALNFITTKELFEDSENWVVQAYKDSCEKILLEIVDEINSLNSIISDSASIKLSELPWRRKFFFALPYLRTDFPADSADKIIKNAAAILEAPQFSDYNTRLNDVLAKQDSLYYAPHIVQFCANMSGRSFDDGNFKRAKNAAAYGIQLGVKLPDQRRMLPPLARYQAAVFADEGLFHLVKAIGERVVRKSIDGNYLGTALNMLYNLGDQHIQTEELEEALRYLSSAQEFLKEQKDRLSPRTQEWYGKRLLERMAVVYRKFGENKLAQQNLQEYEKLVKTGKENVLLHNFRGLNYRNVGQFAKAKDEFLAGIKIASRQEGGGVLDIHNLFVLIHNLAELHLEYDFYDDALKVWESWKQYEAFAPDLTNYPGKNASPLQNNEANLHGDQLDAQALDKEADASSIKGFMNVPRRIDRDILGAEIFYKLGRKEKAELLISDLLDNVDALNLKKHQIELALSASHIIASIKGYETARSRLLDAANIAEDDGSFLRRIDLKILEFELAQSFQKADVSVADFADLISEIEEKGYYSLLPKAIGLVIKFAWKTQQRNLALEYAQKMFDVVKDVSEQQETVEGATFYNHSTDDGVKTAIECLLRFGDDEEAFLQLNRFKNMAMRNKLLATDEGALAYSDIQPFLRPGETLIDYFSGDTLYAFVVQRDGFSVKRFDVTRLELQRLTNEYFNIVSDEGLLTGQQGGKTFYRSEYLKTLEKSHQLYKKVVQKIDVDIPDSERLLIVPDAHLYSLSFASLAIESAEKRNDQFLIEKHAIAYLPGAWALKNRQQPVDSTPFNSIVASLSTNMRGAEALNEKTASLFPALHRDIRKSWKDKEEFWAAIKTDPDISLLFAHAFASWENPQQSFIELPLSDSTLDALYAHELEGIGVINSRLAILAGCETIGVRTYWGSGLVGLQRSLMLAGIDQVVSTNWKVFSIEAANTIADFLGEFKNERDPIIALQKAQIMAIDRLKKDRNVHFPFPHIWSAYTLYGLEQDNAPSTN